jgi:hypothetical protein
MRVVKNFAMSMDPDDFKEVDTLTEMTEGMDSIFCSAMHIVEDAHNELNSSCKFMGDKLGIVFTV